MSSDEPVRSVPDELFRQVSAKPERQLPDALFGPPPEPAEPERRGAREDAARTVPDELFKQKVSAKPERQLPDALFGGPPASTTADATDAGNDHPTAQPDDPANSGIEEADGVTDAVSEAEAAAAPVTVATADASSTEAVSPAADPPTEASPVESGDAEPSVPTVPHAPAESAAADSPADVPAPAQDAAGAVASAESKRPVLLVIADSLAYFGPKGGLPADHPRIWPNLVAAELDWDVELVGRIGWTCRDAYWALIGDPRVWAAVPRAGAVVFAVGGMDTLPSPLPTALRELIRYVRPPALRRRVRATYNWLQPRLSKLGRPVALPPRVSIDYLEQSRQALAQLRPDLPVIGVLPSVHNCEAYGRVHSGRPRAVKALREWSARTAVPLVDLGEAVRENIFSGEANPDGIHWGWDGHTAVANAMVKTLQEVR
ncbi:GDSL-type esterase/lipase family protein [Nocardia farcinica]|nr:diglucosylglycerate octanoyltransferase [Nocardia farcinica]MCZ9328010.1 GDSL-type esterase/lipase family protein [Nocardia farcinica]